MTYSSARGYWKVVTTAARAKGRSKHNRIGAARAFYADMKGRLAKRLRELFAETVDVVEVVRRLWDSWEDDAEIFTGTPAELAGLVLDWRDAGLHGFRLRLAALPHDLVAITRGLVPELQRRGAFRTGYEPGTLRERLGPGRPVNRYAVR